MSWQPIETAVMEEDREPVIVLDIHNRPHLVSVWGAEHWDDNKPHWIEWLRGGEYGLGLDHEAAYWMPLPAYPEKSK